MRRRLIALITLLAIGLQGPILAYAAAATPAGSTLTTPVDCPGRVPGSANNDTSCCPQGILAGICCAGSVVFTTMPSLQVLPPAPSLAPAPLAGDSSSFATQTPGPQFRPPIV